MGEHPLFADVLQQYVKRSAYTAGQLSRLSGIPKTTIVSWLNGQVQRPQTAKGLAQLSYILHLNESETGALFQAAGHPPSFPVKQKAVADVSAPFQAVPKLPYFSGREQLITQIQEAIIANRQRNIVCLYGMAGVGKTALAAQLAYRLRAFFPDGVLWIETSRTGTMASLSTMAHGYGLDVSPFQNIASRSRVVGQLLVDKQFLLVLDDVNSSAEIADILPTAPNCTVLLTTRRQNLGAAVGGLRFEIRPFSAAEDEALSLFGDLLQRDFDASEKKQLRQIADILGQLPLAVAIAASRLAYEPGWQIGDFLARLQQTAVRLDLLTYEGLSVSRSFALSFERLSLPLQQFLAGLAIFNGHSFTDTAVAAIHHMPLAEAQDNLRVLHNLSLVQSQATDLETRYQLHTLLHECVSRLSLPKKQQANIQRRYVQYYLSLIQADLAANFATASQEGAHFLTALKLAKQANRWPEIFSGLKMIYPYLKNTLPPVEIEPLLQSAELAAGKLGQTDVMIWCQIRRMALARHQTAFHKIPEILHSLTVLTRNPDYAEQRPLLCLEKGKTAVFDGNWIAASQYYEEGIHLAQKKHLVPEVLIDLWQALGNLTRWRGQPHQAASLFQAAVSLASQTQDRVRLATLYDHLAWLAIEQQDYDSAAAFCAQGLAIAEQISHQERLSVLYNTFSVVRHYQGDWAGSETYQQVGFDIARSLKLLAHSASIAASRGGLAWQKEQYELAEQFWQESDQLARHAQDVNNLVNVRLSRAEKYLQANLYEKSLTQYQAVLAALPPQASRTSCGYAKGSFGVVQSLLGLGKKNAARPYLRDSLAAFARVDVPMVAELRHLALFLQIDLEDIPQF